MKVFVAGVTGAIGKQLLPMLVEEGHEVTGMTRIPAKADAIRAMGAKPAVADALDPEAVAEAVAQARPDAVVHELTAIDASVLGRSIDKMFAQTNRLRTAGTDHLLTAAKAAGARRFIAQSFAGWPFERVGNPIKTEEDPLQEHPPKTVSESLAAIKYLESAVTGASGIEGLALRYGGFLWPRDFDCDQPRRRTGRDDPEAPPSCDRRRGRDLVRWSMSATPPQRPRLPSTTVSPASSTSSTTIRRGSRRSSPSWRRWPEPAHRVISRAGSDGCSPARRTRS